MNNTKPVRSWLHVIKAVCGYLLSDEQPVSRSRLCYHAPVWTSSRTWSVRRGRHWKTGPNSAWRQPTRHGAVHPERKSSQHDEAKTSSTEHAGGTGTVLFRRGFTIEPGGGNCPPTWALPPNVLVTAAVCSCKQLYQGRTLAFKIRQNAFPAGLRPEPRWGSLWRSSDPLSYHTAPRFSRLWRLDFGGHCLKIFSSRTAPGTFHLTICYSALCFILCSFVNVEM